MYVCMYVCMHACTYIRMYVCMYVCMNISKWVCILLEVPYVKQQHHHVLYAFVILIEYKAALLGGLEKNCVLTPLQSEVGNMSIKLLTVLKPKN
jgi:hypothetical protein